MFCFSAKIARTSLLCNDFLIFSYPSHLKHLVLRAFLEDCLPERLSKVGVLAERGMKKSNTSRDSSDFNKNQLLLCFLGRWPAKNLLKTRCFS